MEKFFNTAGHMLAGNNVTANALLCGLIGCVIGLTFGAGIGLVVGAVFQSAWGAVAAGSFFGLVFSLLGTANGAGRGAYYAQRRRLAARANDRWSPADMTGDEKWRLRRAIGFGAVGGYAAAHLVRIVSRMWPPPTSEFIYLGTMLVANIGAGVWAATRGAQLARHDHDHSITRTFE